MSLADKVLNQFKSLVPVTSFSNEFENVVVSVSDKLLSFFFHRLTLELICILQPSQTFFFNLRAVVLFKLFLGTKLKLKMVNEEKVKVVVDVLANEHLKHSPELLHTHSEQVDCLDD